MEKNNDEQLWIIAKKRAKFKMSCYTYIVVNVLLWAVYFITNKNNYNSIPWPAWASLGWGVGLVFQYIDAYQKSGNTLEQKEFEKLKQNEGK